MHTEPVAIDFLMDVGHVISVPVVAGNLNDQPQMCVIEVSI